VPADTPALVGFHDLAAERLAHDLVAETDADLRRARLGGCADELRQRSDPGQRIVHPGG
jgi:hypothetical protein